jgi:preprotein translocase subunit SecD
MRATNMLRTSLATLIGLVVVFVVSLLLASVIGLGPEEFWILPMVLLAALALTLAQRHRITKRRTTS